MQFGYFWVATLNIALKYYLESDIAAKGRYYFIFSAAV